MASPHADRVATLRHDAAGLPLYLGTVSKDYRVFQNESLIELAEALAGEGAVFETAGAIRNGRRVWILCRTQDSDLLVGDDRVSPYFLLTNGHDGTLALRGTLTAVRVVCANTLGMALGLDATTGFGIVHRGDVMGKAQQAAVTLGWAKARQEEAVIQWDAMAAAKIGHKLALEYFQAWAAPEEPSAEPDAKDRNRVASVVGALEASYHDGPGARPGTVWGAYNAVTDYVSHLARFRSAESRFESLLYGEANSEIIRAGELAQELVEAVS